MFLTKSFVSLKKLLLKFYEMRFERGISIDADSGPFMYFDAAVVFVTSQTLLFRLALAILCNRRPFDNLIVNVPGHF